MKKKTITPVVYLFLLLLFSCTKPASFPPDTPGLSGSQSMLSKIHSNLLPPLGNYMPPAGSYWDTIETPTILGQQLTNPYSLDNMTMAYNIVHGTSISRLSPTNLYVRFLPSDVDQLALLADSLDLDLFDTPMDYSITQDGDYYQDPTIPMEQITRQYAVVQPGFQFPAGITHQVLDSIYIPGNNDYAVEDMAFQLAGNPEIDDPGAGGAMAMAAPYSTAAPGGVVRPNVLQCDPGYHWDFDVMGCVANNCGPGTHWDNNSQSCVADEPLPPIEPPGPGSHYPAGYLSVYDTNHDHDDPLRHVRVVAKRWFKIQRLYTDDNGYFESTKRFHKKVKIIVKFKNDYSLIRCVRGVRVWQAYMPLTVNLGKWKNTLNNISHTFTRNTDNDSKGTRYWIAGTINNARQEYDENANNLNIGKPNGRLCIIITNWGGFNGAAATPMYAQYPGTGTVDDVQHFIDNFAVATPFQGLVAGGTRALASVFFRRMDIIFGYASAVYDQSDRVKETIYHEFTHAAHYAKVGGGWWGAFRMALISEDITSSGEDKPYGDGTSSINSPIIALAESWAYHIGYEMEDMHYGLTCSTFFENGDLPFTTHDGISSAEHFEEEFNPNLTSDPFHWIPAGLYHDMIDDVNETKSTGGPVDDFVNGYTDAGFFNALDNDVNDLGDYRQRLLQENSNDQSIQVTDLFGEYGY